MTNRFQTTTTASTPTPAFYFKAYGNSYIADGTTLGRGEYDAMFDKSNRPFYVNSSGAFIDIATGDVAVVNLATTANIFFLPDGQASKYGVCNCIVGAADAFSCICDGVTGFSADAGGYLYIGSGPSSKKRRSMREFFRRQGGASPVSISAQPTAAASSSTSPTSASQTTKYSTSCGSILHQLRFHNII